MKPTGSSWFRRESAALPNRVLPTILELTSRPRWVTLVQTDHEEMESTQIDEKETMHFSFTKSIPHQQWALHLCVYKLNVIFAPIEVPPGLGPLPKHLIQCLYVPHPLIF